MDAREIRKTPRRLMNLHNNEAGRKVKKDVIYFSFSLEVTKTPENA